QLVQLLEVTPVIAHPVENGGDQVFGIDYSSDNLSVRDAVIGISFEQFPKAECVSVIDHDRRFVLDSKTGLQHFFGPLVVLADSGNFAKWDPAEDVGPNGRADRVKVNEQA